jgi:hypothetical protein
VNAAWPVRMWRRVAQQDDPTPPTPTRAPARPPTRAPARPSGDVWEERLTARQQVLRERYPGRVWEPLLDGKRLPGSARTRIKRELAAEWGNNGTVFELVSALYAPPDPDDPTPPFDDEAVVTKEEVAWLLGQVRYIMPDGTALVLAGEPPTAINRLLPARWQRGLSAEDAKNLVVRAGQLAEVQVEGDQAFVMAASPLTDDQKMGLQRIFRALEVETVYAASFKDIEAAAQDAEMDDSLPAASALPAGTYGTPDAPIEHTPADRRAPPASYPNAIDLGGVSLHPVHQGPVRDTVWRDDLGLPEFTVGDPVVIDADRGVLPGGKGFGYVEGPGYTEVRRLKDRSPLPPGVARLPDGATGRLAGIGTGLTSEGGEHYVYMPNRLIVDEAAWEAALGRPPTQRMRDMLYKQPVGINPDHVVPLRDPTRRYRGERVVRLGGPGGPGGLGGLALRRVADHFDQLDSSFDYMQLYEQGVDLEPTHPDIMPSADPDTERAIFMSWADFREGCLAAGIMPPDDAVLDASNANRVELPVDALIATQPITVGRTRSTGPIEAWPIERGPHAGKWAVTNGHHRAVGAILDDKPTVEAWVPAYDKLDVALNGPSPDLHTAALRPRVAAVPPEHEEELLHEIKVMRRIVGEDPEAASPPLNSKREMQREWLRLQHDLKHFESKQKDHQPAEELARIRVLSDSVIETLSFEGNQLLYGKGGRASDLAEAKWCTVARRDLFDTYADTSNSTRRFIVLPDGPERYETINGTSVPVGRRPLAVTVKTTSDTMEPIEVDEIQEHLNRGSDVVPTGVVYAAMQKLDAACGTDFADDYKPLEGWEDFPYGEEVWRKEFGTNIQAAYAWAVSPYARQYTESGGSGAYVARACGRNHAAGMSPEEAMNWAKACGSFDIADIRQLHREGVTPPTYAAYAEVLAPFREPGERVSSSRVIERYADAVLDLRAQGIGAGELSAAVYYVIKAGLANDFRDLRDRLHFSWGRERDRKRFARCVQAAKLLHDAGIRPTAFEEAASSVGVYAQDIFHEVTMDPKIRVRFIKRRGLRALAELVKHTDTGYIPENIEAAWQEYKKTTSIVDDATNTNRTAAIPPADDATLEREIALMEKYLAEVGEDTSTSANAAGTLRDKWLALNDTMRENLDVTPFDDLARVKVLSDSVVETLTFDANALLYGENGLASDLVKAGWCTVGSRYYFDKCVADDDDDDPDDRRRFIVLPRGPEKFVKLNGVSVPVASDPIAVVVDGTYGIVEINDSMNMGSDRVPAKLLYAAMRKLDAVIGTDFASDYKPLEGWEEFPYEIKPWRGNFGDEVQAAMVWAASPYARALEDYGDSGWGMAQECARVRGTGMSPEEAMNWVQVCHTPYLNYILPVYLAKVTPPTFEAYAAALDKLKSEHSPAGRGFRLRLYSSALLTLRVKGVGASELSDAIDYVREACRARSPDDLQRLFAFKWTHQTVLEEFVERVQTAKLLRNAGIPPSAFQEAAAHANHPDVEEDDLFEEVVAEPRARVRFIKQRGLPAFAELAKASLPDGIPQGVNLSSAWRALAPQLTDDTEPPESDPTTHTALVLRRVAPRPWRTYATAPTA